MALSEQLRESANTPEAVLSEVSAAMAVLASDGKLASSLSLSLCYTNVSLLIFRACEEADHGAV